MMVTELGNTKMDNLLKIGSMKNAVHYDNPAMQHIANFNACKNDNFLLKTAVVLFLLKT